MTGQQRVWTALRRGGLDRPPKGEILVERTWLERFGWANLSAAIAYLQADLVVLPLQDSSLPLHYWRGWGDSNPFVFGFLQGPLTHLTMQLGWHEFSRLLIKQPATARAIMERFLENSVQDAAAALEQGCEGIVVADDLAGDKGPLISPAFLADHYFPLMHGALERLDYRNVPVIFHSDGNIVPLLTLIRKTGFWGIHGLEPTVGIGPEALRGGELADWIFWGNFAFEGTNRLKNTGEVTVAVDDLLCRWADFPGYIFGSSGGIYKDLNLPQIKAAYEVVERWRRPNICAGAT